MGVDSEQTRRVGRPPTAFTNERANKLADLLEQGYSPKRACSMLGIAVDVYYAWMLKGRLGEEPYVSFRETMLAAIDAGMGRTPPGRRLGRVPSDIPSDKQDQIVEHLRQGRSYHVSCRRAGVNLGTFVSWLRLGGYPRQLSPYRPIAPEHVAEPYRSFAAAVLQAEQDVREQRVDAIPAT